MDAIVAANEANPAEELMQTSATVSTVGPSRRIPISSTSIELAQDALAELRQALGPPRCFSRGQYLFRAGERCAALFLVEEGCVKVSTLSRSGDEQVANFCLPGEPVGLEALGEPVHGSSAIALEPTRVRPLSIAAIQNLCQRSPALTRRLFRLVSKRISELEGHMLMLGCKTAPERVAGFLVDLTQRTRSHELQLGMSREAIGSYLGIALETVSRLLHQFEDEKLIRVSGRQVRLLRPERLRELAADAWVRQ
jgi:CRP/FNR family transcriptional regulator, anaerobic regulatory protein